jgi:hypothetical protein
MPIKSSSPYIRKQKTLEFKREQQRRSSNNFNLLQKVQVSATNTTSRHSSIALNSYNNWHSLDSHQENHMNKQETLLLKHFVCLHHSAIWRRPMRVHDNTMPSINKKLKVYSRENLNTICCDRGRGYPLQSRGGFFPI